MKQTWGVIFDWDGVLVDSSTWHEQSWEILARELGYAIPAGSFQRGFGLKNEVIIPTILQWAQAEDEVARLAHRKETLYRQLARDGGLSFLPGARILLDRLAAAGVPCVIGSSTERANITVILESNQGAGYFRAILSGEDVTHGKPAPDIFLKAHQALGTEYAVVIEDALPGVEAALRGGLPVVAVTTTRRREELDEATWVVDDLAEVSVEALAVIAGADAAGPVNG